MASKQNDELQQINQEIYKRNLELAVVNKTLSLLRKLYQISLAALNPVSLSERMSEAVRDDLNMEIVGMFLYDESADSLQPLRFSQSRRLSSSLAKIKPAFMPAPVSPVAMQPTFKQVIARRSFAVSRSLDEVWDVPAPKKLKAASDAANIKAVLIYPLVSQDKCIGALMFGLNREYPALSEHEQESIRSLTDVVAVALDNALLYQKLEVSNKQLLDLDRARAEFISIASHQLRTPPATIKWYLAAVMAGDYGKMQPKMHQAVERAQITNDALIGLIDDMLNASRIERGKMEFIFEPSDFEQLVAQATMQLQPQATMRMLKLVYRKPSSNLPKILADKEKLSQVANNLIDNAIKYSKAGTVTVSIKQEKGDLVLRVKDQGRGLAQNELTGIFEKYGRGKDSQRQASGLGLGLYVAKVVTEHHKGRIWAESEGLGKGSTFVVSLPIKTDLKAETFDLVEAQKS